MPRPNGFAAVWLAAFLAAFGLGADTYNVRDYGARADGRSNDAAAIQAAIDACHQSGGGIVRFPSGQYLSGMVRLRSRVTVRLENVSLQGLTLRVERGFDYGQRFKHGGGKTNPNDPRRTCGPPQASNATRASRAAATVASISSSLWAAERNRHSNWLHGKYTPRRIISQKNRA